MGSIQRICIAWLFVFASLVLYASMAKAEILAPVPEPLVGTYSFTDTLEGVMLVDVRVVHTISKAGREELKHFRSLGYACEAKPRQTYRCTDHLEIQTVGEEIRRRVYRKMGELTWVEFPEMSGGVNLETDGESYKMWRVDRHALTSGGEYKSYEISWTPSLSKVILRDQKGDLETEYFNVVSPDTLNMQMTVSKTFDRKHFQIYVVRALFEKE